MSIIETSEKSTQDLPAEWWSRAPTRLPQLPAKPGKAQLVAWVVVLLVRFDAPKSQHTIAKITGASTRTVGRVLKLSPLDRLAVAEGYMSLYPKRPKRPITDTAVLDFVRRVGPNRVVEAACEIEREITDKPHKTCGPVVIDITQIAAESAVQ